MFESLHKFMRVGIIHFMIAPSAMKGEGPVLETVRRLACDDYFDAIELTWIKDPAVRQQVADLLRVAHMDVAFGAQPILLTTGQNINDLDEAGRLIAVQSLKAGIDQAYELGAQGFSFLSGKYAAETIEQSYSQLVKSTREICDYARMKGSMRIALEVFDFDIDKKSLIGPASLARRFAGEIRQSCDNFGLMVDLSHIPLLHETIMESLEPVKEFIIHAHMGNCVVKDKSLPAYGDAHPRFGFANSENDVAELTVYLRYLLQIGFLNETDRPFLSFEVKPFGNEDPELVLANAKRTLNLAWSKV